jgi:hypothetical protein
MCVPSDSLSAVSILLDQVVDVYRSKLRNDIAGIEGDEIARKRIEVYANSNRPAGFVVYPYCTLDWIYAQITLLGSHHNPFS